MDEPGQSGDVPLSPRDSYSRQHNTHRHDQLHAEAERVLAAQHAQQPHRPLNVPALAAALPAWSREAADTLFAFLERGDNAQAAAMSEALPGLNFPALSAAGRSALSPAGPLRAQHPLQQSSALQTLHHQHPLLTQTIPRRADDQSNQGLGTEHFGAPSSDPQSLLAQYHLQTQHLAAAPRPRWKPNAGQIALLEAHFSAGHSKPTPELTAAVQHAGSATEQQVVVWLKNRLARAKRDAKDSKDAAAAPAQHSLQTEGGESIGGRKRSRSSAEVEDEADASEQDEPAPPVDFHGIASAALREVHSTLDEINAEVVAGVKAAISRAHKVCCYGVGREGLVLKAFATSLHHMRVNACVLGESCCSAVGHGDVLLISAGPNKYPTVSTVASEAKNAGAKVVAFTAHRTAPIPFADMVVRLPVQQQHQHHHRDPRAMPSSSPEGPRAGSGPRAFAHSSPEAPRAVSAPSILQPGAAYQLALQLLLDTMAAMYQHEHNISHDGMRPQQSNLQ